MISSVHGLSDNSDPDEQQNHIESQIRSESPANGMSHPGIVSPSMHHDTEPQLGVGNGMRHCMFQAQTLYPYPDPYYRSIFAPCDMQPYTSQPYPPQPMLMGIQQTGVPLLSDAVEEPIFVNAKQYHGILRRRQSRATKGLSDCMNTEEGKISCSVWWLDSEGLGCYEKIVDSKVCNLTHHRPCCSAIRA